MWSDRTERITQCTDELARLDQLEELHRLPEVNHKGPKSDCRASMLEWTNKRGNSVDAVKTGRTEKEIIAAGLKLVPDHVKALVNGGTNTIDNLQPLCNGIGGA